MAFKQISLYQQIQSLKTSPTPRSVKYSGNGDESKARAAKWKLLSNELRSLLIEVVHLQMTNGSEERIEFLEAEIRVIEADRDKLKAEYWKTTSTKGDA